MTPGDLDGSPPPYRDSMDGAPHSASMGSTWPGSPTPGLNTLTASVLLGPWPTLLQGGWGSASQHPLHFGAQIHSLWSMNICLDQKISIWSSASAGSPSSCPLLPCSTEARRKPTSHPPTPRLQPAQDPHSELSLGRPVAPCPCALPTISGSIPSASHPKGPSLWLQPLMSRPFQLDLRLRPPSSLLRLPHPQLSGMSSPRFPFASQGLPFCKILGQDGGVEESWASCDHSWAFRVSSGIQEPVPLGPTHRAEILRSHCSVKDCGGSQTGS